MRAWEGGGGGKEVAWVRTARLVSSSPFYRAFASPSARWLASDALPAAMRWWLFVFTFAGEEDAFFNRSRCPAIAVLGWIGKAEGEGRGNV